VIVKEGSEKDASMFLRNGDLDDNGVARFVTRQGLAGTGAVSKYCFGTLTDDCMFLSKEGVFGLDSMNITLRKTMQRRSEYIDGRLGKEADLSEAVACIKDGLYYLFINGSVYIANSFMVNRNSSGSRGYEWFYWTDVPCRVCAVINDEIYLGTKDGHINKLKTEEEYGIEAYNDNNKAISASWSTRVDDLGDAGSYKKIQKKGTGVLVMPFEKTSGRIYYLTAKGSRFVKDYGMSTIFDFENIDFENFSFGESKYPLYVPTRKKHRKVNLIQIVVENGELNEAFGLLGININYSAGHYLKRPG
jgi:hypothetical protein